MIIVQAEYVLAVLGWFFFLLFERRHFEFWFYCYQFEHRSFDTVVLNAVILSFGSIVNLNTVILNTVILNAVIGTP
jgi:hypothetical protein